MSQQFKEGDAVLVIPTSYGHRQARQEPIPAMIVKAARVWLTIAVEKPYPREWRMRRETQREETGTNYSDRFVTAEQYEAEQRAVRDLRFLNEQGVVIGPRSPWRDRVSELADLIRKAVA
jgi:hypothetical protein